MDWASLYGNSSAPRELAQYPDERLYKSASLLKPEERPTVPVKLIDPDPKKYPIFRLNPNVAGLTDRINNQIWVNRNSEDYKKADKDPYYLSALMAHEQVHNATKSDDEGAPYQATLRVLDRSGHMNPAYRQKILELVRKYNQ